MFSFPMRIFLLHQMISHFFVVFPDILATEDGFRVSLSRAVENEPLIMSSSTVASVSVSRDTRPVEKSAVWDPHSFFYGSPPIRATRDGHMGCWKTRILGSWKAYKYFDFIRDKQPVVRPSTSNFLLEKRQASSVIAPVSSCNVFAIFQNLKLFYYPDFHEFHLMIDFGFVCSPHLKSRSLCLSLHHFPDRRDLHTTRKMTTRTMRVDCGQW